MNYAASGQNVEQNVVWTNSKTNLQEKLLACTEETVPLKQNLRDKFHVKR
jgi:hypothetical protein